MFGSWTFPIYALKRWWKYTVLRKPMRRTVVQGEFNKLFRPGIREAFLEAYNEKQKEYEEK